MVKKKSTVDKKIIMDTTKSTISIQSDINITAKSSQIDQDKFISYFKSMNNISKGAEILLSLDDTSRIDILCLAALSIWQTRKGTTISSSKCNPGIIPNIFIQGDLDSLKEGYKEFIKVLESHIPDSGGIYLSSWAKLYVQYPVSKKEFAGLNEEDLKKNNVQKKDGGDFKNLQEQRQYWYGELQKILNDLYDKILEATPAWSEHDSSDNTYSGESPSEDGVTTESMVPHGKHMDSILVKLPSGKTFSEPVYPDLLTVADSVPQKQDRTSTIVPGKNSSLFNMDQQLDIEELTKLKEEGFSVSIERTNKPSADIEIHSENKKDSTVSKNAQIKKVQKDLNKKKEKQNSQINTSKMQNLINTSREKKEERPPFFFSSDFDNTEDSALNITKQLTENDELNNLLKNGDNEFSRQVVFNPEKHKNCFKEPTLGKPANNNDLYPVDLKIEELELHFPHSYIHELKVCPEGKSVGEALMKHASNTEKRLVKLENILATLVRYVFSLGSRVPINCVFYGGQSQYNKYKCIRCLKDNRLEDGQIVSIDQCLNCTRYQPDLGAVYEIINEKGSNLAQIMDDNQMSYSNMREYTNFVKTEEYSDQLKNKTLGSSAVSSRDPSSKDFKDIWSEGIKMDWKLVPVEDQKPHIGWRQSINDDGSYLKLHKLSSYQFTPENMGVDFGAMTQTVWDINKNSMDSNNIVELITAINLGKMYGRNNIQEIINGVRTADWIQAINQRKQNEKIDMDTVAIALIIVINHAYHSIGNIINRIKTIENTLKNDKIKNQIITATCFAIPGGEKYFLSTSSIALDKNIYKKNTKEEKSKRHTLDRKNINNWQWVDFAPYLSDHNLDISLVPRICYAYENMNRFANNAITGINAAMKVYLGKTMDNGRRGCCEAVTKIGSYFSTFLKRELSKHVVACDALFSDAKAAGVPTIAFSIDKLEPGDTIYWIQSASEQHVVIANGGYKFVGNSSSKNCVIYGNDYRMLSSSYPKGPTYIIKTSKA